LTATPDAGHVPKSQAPEATMPARRTRRLRRTVAGTLAVVAIAAPAAGARPALEPAGGTSSGSPAAIEREAEAAAPTVIRIDQGFEWGSAAIGAGGAAVVLLLTVAGAATVSRRQHRIGVVR
jgi:hypothetical protein